MELAPAGVPISFEVTYDSPSLYVGMTVYDDTGVTPVFIETVSMLSVGGSNTYRAKFTPDANSSYIILKSVYTDVGLTIPNLNYGTGSESIYAQNSSSDGGGGSSGDVVGYVDNNDELIGIVTC
jgi:hypothetical protein